MKNVISLATVTAVLIAGAFSASAAARRDAPVPESYGEQVERPAAEVFSAKELHRRGLSAAELVVVTKAPNGPVDTSRGR